MSQFVSCPKCGHRARIPETLMGKSVKCPGCAETFTATASPPAPLAKKGADDGEDIEVVEDEKGRPADEDDPDEERRRRRRRLGDDEEDDEEERPQKRKKRRRRPVQGDGPWLLAIGVAGACVAVAFFFSLLVEGTAGLPPAQDGPIVKYLALGFAAIVALAISALGIDGVRKREVTGRYYFSEYKITGTWAVVVNMIQTAIGGCLGGWVVYALLFTLIRGR